MSKIKDPKKKEIPKVKGWFGKTKFVESILNSKPLFLVKDVNDWRIFIKDIFETDTTIIRPLYQNEYGYIPYSFTLGEIRVLVSHEITMEEIADDIFRLAERFVVAPRRVLCLIVGNIVLSYSQEWVYTLHFPFFVGETESGKSSALRLAMWLAYRCILSEDITNANIYNYLGIEEEGAGTIAEDEAQKLGDNEEKLRTYKGSYAKGSTKPRIIMTSKSKYQVFYKTFCSKWFAGESVPQDKGFLERVVIIPMQAGKPLGNIKRPTEEEKFELNRIRNKILIWKMQNIGKKFPRIASGLTGRDQELWEDFLSIFSGTKYESLAKETAEYYLAQRRDTVKESLESIIFRIIKLRLEVSSEIEMMEIWEMITNSDELPGRLDYTEKTFYPDYFDGKITLNSLSKILLYKYQAKKVVRFKSVNGKNRQTTYYVFDAETVAALSEKYLL